MRRTGPDAITLAAFLVAVIFLGANWVGVRFSNRELPPFFGAALRFALASLILFAVVALRRIAIPHGRALLGAVVYGSVQYFAFFGLAYWALVAVPAGMGSVVLATLPLWTLFIAAAVGFERLGGRSILGAVVALAGLAVIFGSELTADVPPLRVGAILAAAILAAVTNVVVKAFPRTHPIATTAVGTAVGVLPLLLVSRLVGETWALPQQVTTWLALGYLVLSTCVAFVLLVYVILRWTPSASAYAGVASPVVTVVCATLLAGEAFGLAFFLGAIVVGLGTYVGALAPLGRTEPRAVATVAQ